MPVMMMFVDPFRMILVPPSAVAPNMVFVPVAVVVTPFRICVHPFGMMMVDPVRMVVVPPMRVAPFMMLIPVTVVMLGMCNHRRNRKQRCEGRSGKKKFEVSFLVTS